MQELEIKRPLHGRYICIRESYLLSGPRMKVKIPQGESEIDTKEWMKTGKKMEKVFLYEGKPLKLWCNYLAIPYEDNEAQLKLL